MMTLYGDPISGNCQKVQWTADFVGARYAYVVKDVVKNETRTPDFLVMFPQGQVPAVAFDDGRTLAQSNAIIRYLARGSDLIPADAYDAAKMDEWLFWEQYSHEPYIAVRRFRKKFLNQSDDELDPQLLQRGRRALGVMELQLTLSNYFVGESLTLADIALVAYTRWADEGGFDLSEFPNVQRWVARVETDLGIEHARKAA